MKFNEKKITTKVENLAGGQSYKESSKLDIASQLLTSFVENQFYQGKDTGIERFKNTLKSEKDKKFIAKASIYARTKFGMRSITHISAGEIAKEVKKEQWTKFFYEDVIHRPDDIVEILAYYINTYGKPIPNSLKKGLAKAFDKFDDYQISKYKIENGDIKLIDAVNLLHPRPTKKNEKSLKELVEGKLINTDTWETRLTQAGQKANSEEEKEELKKEAWKSLIMERKIGYFALLRNLRNIINQADEETKNEAMKLLVDEKMIKNSLVLPFRYSTAYSEIEKINTKTSRECLVAIDKAIEISCKNVPKLDGETLVALDVSGSMSGKPSEIASLFCALLCKINNCDVIMFENNAVYKNYNPQSSINELRKSFKFNAGGTNFHSIFQTANKKYDRIIILSDMQGWIGYDSPVTTFNQYCKKYNCKPKIYSFDLNGYGTLQFPEKDVYCLAGFSDKIFDIMKLLEEDKNAMINEIEKIKLREY